MAVINPTTVIFHSADESHIYTDCEYMNVNKWRLLNMNRLYAPGSECQDTKYDTYKWPSRVARIMTILKLIYTNLKIIMLQIKCVLIQKALITLLYVKIILYN